MACPTSAHHSVVKHTCLRRKGIFSQKVKLQVVYTKCCVKATVAMETISQVTCTHALLLTVDPTREESGDIQLSPHALLAFRMKLPTTNHIVGKTLSDCDIRRL